MKWEWKLPEDMWSEAQPVRSKWLDGSDDFAAAALEWAKGYIEGDSYPCDGDSYIVDIRRTAKGYAEARRVKVWAVVEVRFSAGSGVETIAASDEEVCK